MKKYEIALIPGDGIGNEVVPEGAIGRAEAGWRRRQSALSRPPRLDELPPLLPGGVIPVLGSLLHPGRLHDGDAFLVLVHLLPAGRRRHRARSRA